ncbi:MAG TPA: sugar phosphate isomerase/epimerase family protein [Verrucomicrobiae bacterium]|jgi:sugar phosphate isomerase/epimerase
MSALKFSRRELIGQAGLLAGASVLGKDLVVPSAKAELTPDAAGHPFLYCLNTATIRGQKLGIVKEIEVAAQAGYDAIEPWVDSIEAYVKGGGKLAELKQRIHDAGITVEDAIAFPQWIVADDARSAEGLEQAKRQMEMVVQIGGKRLAAPPSGATDLPKLDWRLAAQRYRALLEAGDQIGLVAQFELWGFSKNFNRLGECICVAMETGHPKACVLADVFHLYKGGSEINGMRLLGPTAIQVLHMNDFPDNPSREKIDDSYRTYPGDGTAPMTEILQTLHATGGQKVLSIELFNRAYWSQDALTVAKTGLAKMKSVVSKARF